MARLSKTTNPPAARVESRGPARVASRDTSRDGACRPRFRFCAFRAGYTLVEATIASVVLAACVAAVSGTLSASYQQTAVRGNTATAIALGEQLMEEIAAKPLDVPSGTTDKPGWSAGQVDRRLYDNVSDYHGYSDYGSSVSTPNGSAADLSDGGSYVRTVSVQNNAIPPALVGNGTASDFVLVTVTVTMPHGQATSLSKLFTRVTMVR